MESTTRTPRDCRQPDKPGGAQAMAMELIEAGPHKLQDLARLFESLHPNVLASSWCAILLDSLMEAGLKNIADIARAFNVVAVKLNHRPKRG